MRLSDIARDVGRNFKRRKLRTFLTTSGIAIGTLAICVMVALGSGLHAFLEAQLVTLNDPRTLHVFKMPESTQRVIMNT